MTKTDSLTTPISTTPQGSSLSPALLSAIVLLAISLVINYFAGQYATAHTSQAVTDLILSNTRLPNPILINFLFVQGISLFWVVAIILVGRSPQELPFALKAAALFIIIRAGFFCLTHLGPFPEQVVIHSNRLFNQFSFGGDFFFSGHTGLPFLYAIFYWKQPGLRFFFLAGSIIFGATVLLGHLHYSIDVFGAFFITYTIASLARWFFAADYQRFTASLNQHLA